MGHIEIVKNLLNDPRIDLNATNIQGGTALSLCCSKNADINSTLDIIELLLNHPNIDPLKPNNHFTVVSFFIF